jgi:hypothetical protein
MAMARAGGAKLNRTETVTVRLDPKLNYLCELASRAQRRTKSSFVEWAVAEALKTVELPEVSEYDGDFGGRPVTVHEKSAELWHVDEADRLVALALTAPALLAHDEQLVWKLIRENGFLWRGNFKTGEWSWEVRANSLIRDRLRENWDVFKAVAADELPKDSLPKWNRTDPADDLDDDIPF